MSMLAVQDRPHVAGPTGPVARVAVVAQANGVDPHRLSAAIEHHRDEARRLAAAAKQHRAELRALLRQRDQHIAELRASGWQLARIGKLYRLTKERVGQITAALGLIDDVAVA